MCAGEGTHNLRGTILRTVLPTGVPSSGHKPGTGKLNLKQQVQLFDLTAGAAEVGSPSWKAFPLCTGLLLARMVNSC